MERIGAQTRVQPSPPIAAVRPGPAAAPRVARGGRSCGRRPWQPASPPSPWGSRSRPCTKSGWTALAEETPCLRAESERQQAILALVRDPGTQVVALAGLEPRAVGQGPDDLERAEGRALGHGRPSGGTPGKGLSALGHRGDEGAGVGGRLRGGRGRGGQPPGAAAARSRQGGRLRRDARARRRRARSDAARCTWSGSPGVEAPSAAPRRRAACSTATMVIESLISPRSTIARTSSKGNTRRSMNSV